MTLILSYSFFCFFFFFFFSLLSSLTPCFAPLLLDTVLTDPFFLLACIPGFLLSLEVYALFFTCNLQYFTYMRDVSSYIPTPLVLQNYFTKSAFTNYIITISIINNFFFVLLPLIGRIVYEKVETQKAGAGMNNKGIDSGYLLPVNQATSSIVHLFICSLALTLNQLRPDRCLSFFFFFLSTD